MQDSVVFVSRSLALVLLIAVCIPSVGAAEDQPVTREEVPAEVLSAFSRSYPDASIRGYAIAREEGHVYYEIESVEGAMTRDLLYNPDGSVVEIEESIDATELPEAAQARIHGEYPAASFAKVEKVFRHGGIEYEVKLEHEGTRIGFDFDASGGVLENTVAVASSDLPRGVREAIQDRYPGATFTKAKRVHREDQVEYDVTLSYGEKVIGLVFDATGTILEIEG